MQVGLSPGHIVLDGDPAPLSKKGAEPSNFWPIFIVAGWIKMPLGTEVGLGLGDSVFDRTQLPPEKKAQRPRPNYGPCLL